MFIRDGKKISINTNIVFENVVYTPNDLRSPEIRTKLGITEISNPVRSNPKFYTTTDIDAPPYIVTTPKPDALIREMLWEEIKMYRDTLSNLGGYKVEVETGVFKWFHSDIKSRTQQLGLVLLGANIPNGLKWKTMDSTFVDMTPTLAQQIFAAAATQDTMIFTKAEYHKAVIDNMTGAENFEVYDWKFDWPEVFSPIA